MTTSQLQTTRIAAYALIVRDCLLVLCRISRALPEDAGKWTLPGGGLQFGEHPADAVVREVREETGLRVRPLDVAGIDSHRVEIDGRAHHGVRIIYRVELLGGELAGEIDGTTDHCAWLTLEQARALDLVGLARAGLDLAFPPGAPTGDGND